MRHTKYKGREMNIDEVLEKLEMTDERWCLLENKKNELNRLSSNIAEDLDKLLAGDRKQIKYMVE